MSSRNCRDIFEPITKKLMIAIVNKFHGIANLLAFTFKTVLTNRLLSSVKSRAKKVRRRQGKLVLYSNGTNAMVGMLTIRERLINPLFLNTKRSPTVFLSWDFIYKLDLLRTIFQNLPAGIRSGSFNRNKKCTNIAQMIIQYFQP